MGGLKICGMSLFSVRQIRFPEEEDLKSVLATIFRKLKFWGFFSEGDLSIRLSASNFLADVIVLKHIVRDFLYGYRKLDNHKNQFSATIAIGWTSLAFRAEKTASRFWPQFFENSNFGFFSDPQISDEKTRGGIFFLIFDD